MTKKEFQVHLKSEIQGEIRAYKHIINICKMNLKVRREMLSKKEIERVVNMNKHLWKEESNE